MYIDTHTKETMEKSICSYLGVTLQDLSVLFNLAGNEAQQDKFLDGDKLNDIFNSFIKAHMQMFREVADIQTADMLKLPVPKVNYHNIKTKPSQIQTEMVAGLAKRAEKIRAKLVKPQTDNMLKVTNDGRQLALDQRLIDPMLPDDPNSKVNACVDNIYRIWEEHADTKAAQLVFSDLSTPKNDGTFNIYVAIAFFPHCQNTSGFSFLS